MSEFNEGDLVEAVKGTDRISGLVTTPPDRAHAKMQGKCLHDYESEGWTLTVIEKALPPLPTTDGYYEAERFPIAKGYNAFRLNEGDWTEEGIEQDAEAMASALPLHRLAPVAEVLKKVWDHVAEYGENADHEMFGLAKIAAEYGAAL